jgi:hypothetical protein
VDGEPKEENRSISTALDMKNSFQIGGKRERRSGFLDGEKKRPSQFSQPVDRWRNFWLIQSAAPNNAWVLPITRVG